MSFSDSLLDALNKTLEGPLSFLFPIMMMSILFYFIRIVIKSLFGSDSYCGGSTLNFKEKEDKEEIKVDIKMLPRVDSNKIPLRCPSCCGITDDSGFCPYCGGRLV